MSTPIQGAEYEQHMQLLREALEASETFDGWDAQDARDAVAALQRSWSMRFDGPIVPTDEQFEVLERRHEIRQTRGMRARAKAYEPDAPMVSRQEIIDRDASTCYLCGKTCEPADIHIDHIIPLSKGGTHTADNLAVTHSTCNVMKGAKLLPDNVRPPALIPSAC